MPSAKNTTSLAGASVLLTGASGGIGVSLAEHFAGQGAKLVLTGRREPELAALAERLGARYVLADLAVPGAVDALLAEAGEVDVLLANAALPASGRLTTFTREQINRALQVNLLAPIAMAHALTPVMTERGSGSMVFVSSLAGLTASASTSLYNTTKFGLRGFALALHDELHPSGVGVSVVLPGFVRDAGMFADTGIKAPTMFGTCTPGQVSEAVLRAVRENRAETLVAPRLDRFGARLASAAPNLSSRLQRAGLLGTFGEDMAAQQQDKR